MANSHDGSGPRRTVGEDSQEVVWEKSNEDLESRLERYRKSKRRRGQLRDEHADEVYCRHCDNYVDEDTHTAETSDACWRVRVWPGCNRITLSRTFIGAMVALEEEGNEPLADRWEHLRSDETPSSVVDADTADVLRLDSEETARDGSVHVIPARSDDIRPGPNADGSNPDLPPEAYGHTATDPPETIDELRDLAPEAFEAFEPDENTTIDAGPSRPLRETDWSTFPSGTS